MVLSLHMCSEVKKQSAKVTSCVASLARDANTLGCSPSYSVCMGEWMGPGLRGVGLGDLLGMNGLSIIFQVDCDKHPVSKCSH